MSNEIFSNLVPLVGIYLYIISAAVFAVVIDGLIIRSRKEVLGHHMEFPWVSYPAGIFLALFPVCLYVKLVNLVAVIPDETVVILGGKITTVFPNNRLAWKNDSRLRGQLVSYATTNKTVSMSVSPITENPKVRKVSYRVSIQALGNPKDVIPYRTATGSKKLTDWVGYYLYEFNNSQSKQLAMLYNPLDDRQQNKFENLIRTFLDPHIKPAHVRLIKARFSIE